MLQGALHEDAMQQIFATDRQSMLAEIRDLHAEVSRAKDEKQAEKQRILAELQDVEERFSGREKQWQKKGQSQPPPLPAAAAATVC